MTTIGFVLLAIGITLILIGVIGTFMGQSKQSKKSHTNNTPPEQLKAPGNKNDVLHKMQHDQELKEKILKEIGKKSD